MKPIACLAGLCVTMVLGLLLGRCTAPTEERSRGFDRIPVVIAAEDIPAGTPISIERITMRSIPERYTSRRMVKPDSAGQIIGRASRYPVPKGETLFLPDFEVPIGPALFAVRDLDAGTLLHADDFVTRGVPTELLNAAWYGLDAGVPVRRRLARSIRAGEPLLESALAPVP